MSVSTAQVVSLLENVLFESATLAQTNAASWVAKSQDVVGEGTVVSLALAMAASPEASIVQQVVRYYEGALGRAPAGFEIQYYVGIVEAGLTPGQIAQGASAVPLAAWNVIAADFANSPEFQQISGSTDVVSLLYLNILGRTPAASEVAYYQNQISQGYTPTLLVQEFTNSPEYQKEVGSDIRGAVVTYGSTLANGGTPPSTIPLANTAHATTATLGSAALSVTGGPVTQEIIVLGTPAATAQSAVTAVTGVIGVTSVTAATGVQGVTGVAAVTPVAGRSAVTAVSDGAVTVTDYAFSAGGAGTLKTVNLANSGAGSVINDNALATLDLTGTAGSLTINNDSAGSVALTLSVNGLSAADNTITDTNNEVTTLNVSAITADSTLTAFVDSNLTTLNISGTQKLTLSAINSSLTALAVTDGASFSDGASAHGTGLAALGGALSITHSSTGSFSAVLDDTTQSFTGTGSGADVITVSALADATKTFTAGSSSANEIIFEGGPYALTSASKGMFVNFQVVGVAANVSGTVDLSVIDPTATGLEVLGGNTIAFTNVAGNAALTLDPSNGASVTVKYADSSGASDTIAVVMSSAVSTLVLQDSAGTGIGTVSIANNLGKNETNVSAAHAINTFTDGSLSTLNLTGTAGLAISSLSDISAGLTLNNGSSDGYGLSISSIADTALATLTLSGSGLTTIGTLTDSAAALTISSGAGNAIGTLADDSLTTLTLSGSVSLGQATSPLTSNGLQDGSNAGVTITGGTDDAHVTVNLTAGAATGKTDAITLGNGNNVVVDSSTAGTVTVSLGSGANLVELGAASLNSTASFTVSLAARTATPPNVIVIGTAGTGYASQNNLTVKGATKGDVILFGADSASSNAALTATDLSAAASAGAAIATLEAAATTAHKVVYGVYGGNTYIVETVSGTLGASDTTVVEVSGSQALTASTGYVTLGDTASTVTGIGGLSGSGFTLPAGTATNLVLSSGANVVTLTGPSAGVSDTFTGIPSTSGVTINYQATSGTDTIHLAGVGTLANLTVTDTSAASAGLTIGAFTDNALTSVTYNNSAVTGAVMTQSALTSSSLNTINLTGGVSGQSTNVYFISAALTTQGAVTVNDSNIGIGTTTMGLTLNGGPNALTLNMTGAGTLATGALTDDRLATLTLTGSGTGGINVGALSDAVSGTFTVNDTSASTGAAIIVLTGLSAAKELDVNDSSAGALTDSSTYADASLATLSLNNTGAGALTIGHGGIGTAALTAVNVTGSGAGAITTGSLNDTGTAALTITDTSAGTGLVTLPLDGVSAAAKITVADSAAGGLTLGNIADSGLTTLSLSNTGTAALTLGTIHADAMTSFTFTSAASGSFVLGGITDAVAGAVTITDAAGGATATTLTIASMPNATALTVKDSSAGALTVAAFTDNSASTLTFSNTGSAALTATGITDSAASVTLAITGSGTGSETIGLTAAGATSLTITDTSTATGLVTVTPDMTGGAAALTVTDGAAGALTIGAVTDLNLTQAVLTNTGAGTLTLGTSASGITGGAGLNSVIFEGSGTIKTAVTSAASSGTIGVGTGDSGTVTLSSLNVGTTATDTGTLVVAATTGNLTIAAGIIDVTGLGFGNTGSGLIDATLTDPEASALAVAISDSGRVKLNLTHAAGATAIDQVGSGSLTLVLTGGTTNDLIVLGSGTDTITLAANRAIGSTFVFSATPGTGLNVSPVTADSITHVLTDTATAMGDVLTVGLGAANILSGADASNLWTISAGGMMTKSGASVLNFISFVQGITQAQGVATTSGIAGFYDGTNSWVAYNDHGGHVAVIELAGVQISGIEAGASLATGFVHIA